MDLKDTIAEWLSNINAKSEKTAQLAPQVPQVPQATDDDDPPMPPGRLMIDAKATRQSILDSVKDAVIKRFPIENDKYRLELRDVKYEGPTTYNLAQQKQAILHNRKLGCSLTGTWRLIDKSTGKVLEEKRDSVMRVPYYTNRGTIINNGSEYTVISQARLSPGVYTRRKQNGDLESQFNVSTGSGFRIELDKGTGRMSMRMGQANIPLYPVLKAFGVTDDQIKKSWGSDVAYANANKNDPKAFQKLYNKVAGFYADPLMPPEGQVKYVKDAMAKFGLDPNTVVRTLGIENVNGVTPEVILRASQKLLNVNRGVEDPDNRDNPRFSKFYGIEHILAERISKDSAKLLKPMLFRVGRDKSLNRVGRNALGGYIDDFLSTSGLAQPGEEANPMSILVQQSRITRTGEGGISSGDMITTEARGVQGDYLGFVDPIAGPESSNSGIDVRASYGTVIGKDNKLYNIFRNLRTGKKEYLSLDAAADKVIAFPGQDPKSQYLFCMKNGVPGKVKTSEVDYMVPSMSRMFGAGINMNPTPTAVFGMRSFYSSKFWEQYLPQKKGDTPMVDTLMPDGKLTFNEYYGRHAGCKTSPIAGTVTKVTNDEIVIQGKNGKTETVDIVKNLPYNRMTSLTYFPTVKKGQEVGAGDILAHSNFTDPTTGAFNMGQNLKVAIMTSPRGVSSFEDAIVISEDAAKKLATTRTYNYEQSTSDGININKNKYLAAFPKTFTKDQAELLDDNGVVKVGTELHRGDPIMVAIGPKVLSAENAQLGKLSSVLKNAVTDKSQTWNHDWPGIVTDVVVGPNGAKVLINSEPPIKVGDKLCYDEDTEVLTSHGWKFIKDVTLEDNVATLNPETFEFDYLKPEMVRRYEHKGRMYSLKTSSLDLVVTDNHRMFVQRRDHTGYEFVEAKDVFGKRVSYKKDGVWSGTEIDTFTFPAYQIGHRWGLITKPEVTVSMDTFLMILGMFLSEGSCYANVENGNCRGSGISIAQKKTANVKQGLSALKESGIGFTYQKDYGFRIPGRHFYNYFSQFGYSWDKYIPEFVFGLSVRQQKILFKWLMWGDGYSKDGMHKSYTTTSKRLADDIQRLCLHIGIAGRVVKKDNTGTEHGHIDGRTIVTKHDCYCVQIINSKLTSTVNHSHVGSQHTHEEKYIDYDGYVYCCTMPKWHAIYVRRNGHACWCGNSPRYALKGVVGGIIPMDKIPRDVVTNEPYDMLVNPMGFLSRIAPGQLMEISLGKVAKKTGKKFRIPQMPPPEGWLNWTKKQLADNGVSETADVFDPQTGRIIKGVGDGYMYVQAMHHLAEKKFSARGLEGGYTQDEQPAKGGVDGAKRMCFTYDQPIRVINGEDSIGHIVDNRIPAHVWTRFNDGSWGYSVVTNWFCRKGKMSEVLSISVNGFQVSDTCSNKQATSADKTLHVTRQHHVFTPDRGEILAGDLKPGDLLTSYSYIPTDDSKSDSIESIPVTVTSIEPYNDGNHGPDDEICLYDITVANSHKYCASDCLVSNSGFDGQALLSHGATEVMKDAITVRGTKNEEYWRKLRLGLPIPEPDVPFIYKKFINNLKAGGINVVEKGDITSIMPQTDKDIEKLSEGRIIDSSQMVDSSFDPVKGGLFDLGKTGGMGGTRWSMIELPEPVPNPVMEEPVRRVLGLTSKELSNILSGSEQLNGKTGGAAVKEALKNLDIDAMIYQARNDIKRKRGSTRDNAVKVLGYLTAAKSMNMNPEEWMISKVPVIPPAFRPISKVGDTALIPDTNELYKELIETKHNYEILKDDLPTSALTEERLNIYKAVKAAFGLGNSVTVEGQAKNLKGPIKQVIGVVPKWGQFQSKVIAKNQDLVGRGVTIPDKNLDMDQIGIPEDMAWTMYKPFVNRGLVQRGYSPVDALKMIDERTSTARHILEDVMAEKPVLMDRAPTWHKFNIMAFKPFITDGKEIRICPMIDSGFNMDHDGDLQIGQIRVKISENDTLKLIEKNPNSPYCISMTNMLYFMRRMNKECNDA